jgi:signal transduction histidine kinase
VRRLPVRWRLTLAFAAVMACVLAATGLFVRQRISTNLDNALNASLRAQASGLATLARQSDSGLAEAGGGRTAAERPQLAQLIGASGRVIDATAHAPRLSLLSSAALDRVRREAAFFERTVGAGAPIRLLGIPIKAQDQQLVGVVGQSLEQRDRAISDLTGVLLIGGPLALLLSTAAGYFLAGAALRPVEAMRRRERAFVADASHELRSPLAMLQAELELMARDRPGGAEFDKATASAIEETERLGALMDELLLLSRVDERQLTLHRVPVLADELAKDAVARARRRLTDELSIELTPSGTPVCVRVDRARIGQAIDNLLDNARRYARSEVSVVIRTTGSWVELHVLDDGPGFPAEFLPRAWERFSRAERARTEAGAGLGLSIVRTVAELHGGRAQAANRSAGGADVWIALPAVSEPLGEHRAATEPATAG